MPLFLALLVFALLIAAYRTGQMSRESDRRSARLGPAPEVAAVSTTAHALEACLFAARTSGGLVVLFGPMGSGKTHLVKRLVESRRDGSLYRRAADLARPREQTPMEALCSVPVLAIDDFIPPANRLVVAEVIARRREARLPTVVICSMSEEGIRTTTSFVDDAEKHGGWFIRHVPTKQGDANATGS